MHESDPRLAPRRAVLSSSSSSFARVRACVPPPPSCAAFNPRILPGSRTPFSGQAALIEDLLEMTADQGGLKGRQRSTPRPGSCRVTGVLLSQLLGCGFVFALA